MRTPSRSELETLLALSEDRPLGTEQLAVAERLRRDPSTLQALRRQRHAARALRSGGPAPPPSLAIRLTAQTRGLRDPRRRGLRGARWSGIRIGAVAAAAAVIVLAVTAIIAKSGRSTLPTAEQVAAVWALPASGEPVSANPDRPAELDVSYHGIAYPNYQDHEGWHPVSARHDTIAGYPTVTVLYETGHRRSTYTVVPATGLSVPATAMRLRVGGLSLREFRSGDRWIVTFERNGNTCVLTAAAPRERRWLLKLAAWHDGPETRPL